MTAEGTPNFRSISESLHAVAFQDTIRRFNERIMLDYAMPIRLLSGVRRGIEPQYASAYSRILRDPAEFDCEDYE